MMPDYGPPPANERAGARAAADPFESIATGINGGDRNTPAGADLASLYPSTWIIDHDDGRFEPLNEFEPGAVFADGPFWNFLVAVWKPIFGSVRGLGDLVKERAMWRNRGLARSRMIETMHRDHPEWGLLANPSEN